MSTPEQREVIFTPPPTPNGGLHVGHVSGPYLRADLNRRLANALGSDVVHCSHLDNYQTYVATKAHQLGKDTDGFRHEMSVLIVKDFADFGIDMRWAVDNTNGYYRDFLSEALTSLFDDDHARRSPEYVGQDRRRGAVEAFVSITCPRCLQRAALNVCENCGQPLDLTIGIAPLEESTGATVFVRLPDAALPSSLAVNEDDLQWIRGQHRVIAPDNAFVHMLVDELDEHTVALTFPSEYGYEVAPGRVINPWIEIFFAHAYALGRILELPETMTLDELRSALSIDHAATVTYYFGSDNTYYYAVLFPLLARIMGLPAMLPAALKANRFLRLNGRKMSSSRDNVVWARDLTADGPGRRMRRELAMSCAEFAEQDFRRDLADGMLSWPEANLHAQAVFDSPATAVGRHFRESLAREARPQRFSVAGLLKKIDKAAEFAQSAHGSEHERTEVSSMVGYLRSALEL